MNMVSYAYQVFENDIKWRLLTSGRVPYYALAQVYLSCSRRCEQTNPVTVYESATHSAIPSPSPKNTAKTPNVAPRPSTVSLILIRVSKLAYASSSVSGG